ncbi:hypothetical protein P4234_00180 [Pseudomonas aeruginosa]|nr:hypothetical protein [Pseudomonas aeruginosa]
MIKGSVDIVTGIVRLRFTSNLEDTTGASDIPVIPLLLGYNAVVFTFAAAGRNPAGPGPGATAGGRAGASVPRGRRDGGCSYRRDHGAESPPGRAAARPRLAGRDQGGGRQRCELASAGYSVDLNAAG